MTDETQYDAGDETSVKKRKTKAQIAREQEIEELRQVLSTPQGRAFIWRLLAQTGLYKESFTGNSTTFYNCGKQAIAYWLLAETHEADKAAFIKMQQEALNKEERNG